MKKAWAILRQTAYKPNPFHGGESHFSPIYCARPTIKGTPYVCCSSIYPTYPRKKIEEVLSLFIEAGKILKGTDTYEHDLVDVAREFAQFACFDLYGEMKDAFRKKDKEAFSKASSRFLELILDCDRLLGTRKEFMMWTWIKQARAWGATEEEERYYEEYAKTLVTVWSDVDCLHDYSCRQWNGLLKEFYHPRWKAAIEKWKNELDGKTTGIDIRKWEHSWCRDHAVRFREEPKGDPFSEARRIYGKWKKFS